MTIRWLTQPESARTRTVWLNAGDPASRHTLAMRVLRARRRFIVESTFSFKRMLGGACLDPGQAGTSFMADLTCSDLAQQFLFVRSLGDKLAALNDVVTCELFNHVQPFERPTDRYEGACSLASRRLP